MEREREFHSGTKLNYHASPRTSLVITWCDTGRNETLEEKFNKCIDRDDKKIIEVLCADALQKFEVIKKSMEKWNGS